jgi:hypothetical protein
MSEEQQDRYRATLADLRGKRDRLDALIKGFEEFAGFGEASLTASEPSQRTPAEPPDTPKEDASSRYRGMTIGDAARHFLGLQGEPRSTHDIRAGLEAGGLASSYNSVYARLRHRQKQVGDIVKEGSNWALQEWPVRRGRPGRSTRMGRAKPTPPRPEGPTIGDLTVQFLREAGAPLHAKEIRTKLAAHGKHPSLHTLSSGLIKDRRRRFVQLGGNVYDLAERAKSKA